ncbi:MAG TPA: RHS repeat-associated core domain-containing protein [Pyrinomonadaceae bacterium]
MRTINFIAKNNQNQVNQSNKNIKESKEKRANKVVTDLRNKKIAVNIFSPLLSLCLVLLLFSTVFGQQSTKNTADQVLRSNGRVNPSSLGMEMDISLGSYPARGINLPLGLSYSSKLWRFDQLGTVPLSNGTSNIFVIPRYSENAASGWTTSLSQAFIEYTGEMNHFDDYGRPLQETYDPGQQIPPGDNYIQRVIVYLPGGGSHELIAQQEPIGINPAQGLPANAWEGTYYTTDGSGLKYVQDSANNIFVLWMPDGSFYTFKTGNTEPKSSTDATPVRRAKRLTDAHGNYAEFKLPENSAEQQSYPYGYWSDTLGRKFPVMVPRETPAMPADTEVLEKSFVMPGINANTPYKLRWKRLQGTSAATSALTPNQGYQLKYAGHTQMINSPPNFSPSLFSSSLQMSPCSGDHLKVLEQGELFNPVVLAEVEMPNGAKYRFTYNEYGEIDRIHYPTGGYEAMQYGAVPSLAELAAPYQMSNRGVTSRLIYESIGDTTADTWTYTVEKSENNFRTSTIAPDGTRNDRFMHRGLPPPTCSQQTSLGSAQNYYGTRWGYDNALAGMPYEERAFDSNGALKQRTITRWTATNTTTPLTLYPARYVQRNARILSTETIAYESATTGLSSVTTMEYDTDADDLGSPLNVTKTTQYAFRSSAWDSSISPGQAPPAGVSSPGLPQGLTAVRSAVTSYLSNTAYRDRNLVKLPVEIVVRDGQDVPKAKTTIQYDQTGRLESASITGAPGWTNLGTSVRGLATTATVWEDLGESSETIETYTDYDQFGNVRKTYNANGMTEIKYTDNFSAGGSRNSYAFPTEVTSPQVNGASFVTTTKYEYETGLMIAITDLNGLETRVEYVDPLRRPTKTSNYYQNQPVGNSAETIYGTPDTNGQFPASQRFIKSRTQIDENNWKEGYAWMDGLGRNIKTQSIDAAAGDVFTVSEYDNMGRVIKTSNPFRNISQPGCATNIYCSTTTYDAAGRPWKVKTADGAEVEIAYSLATTGSQLGTVVTIKDQANKQRRSITNAFGQLIRVDEPDINNNDQLGAVDAPNQPTYYLYDTLDNLMTVKQGGTFAQPEQVRSFVYDSLSRVKSASSPESGLIQYTYDKLGNLKTKRDVRNIKTIYDYDALNRVIQRCYKLLAGSSSSLGATTCANNPETAEPNTPDVTYNYDGTYYDAQNMPQTATGAVKGKLTSIKSSISRTNYMAFDAMGRVTASQQITGDTAPDPMTYTYNLSGALVEQKYPSGRVVKNALDANGDLTTVQSKKNQNAGYWNYAQHFTYTTAGAISSMQLGNGRWESTQFNSRLQPTQIALGSTKDATDKLKLNFTYSTTPTSTDNNGTVLSQTITAPTETRGGTTYNGFTATQIYTYDSLNRIKQAVETIPGQTGWKQTFKYDRYGNRNFDYGTNPQAPETTSPSLQATLPKVINPEVLTTNNRFKSDQDNDGINDYLYDAAGNTTKDASGRSFAYDAENKQIEVKDASNQIIGTYFYDGDGRRVRKIAGNEVTLFFYDASGKLVAEYANQISSSPQANYLTADHLGSSRINTDKNGDVTARHDYQPFGEEIGRASYGADNIKKKFTGYERDIETDLDFAQARMYANRLGRFTTVDPIALTKDRLYSPQTINLYAYSKNCPLSFIDPLGEKVQGADKNSQDKYDAYKKWVEDQYKKDPKKFAGLMAAIKTLEESGVLYRISVTTSSKLGEGVEGSVDISSDGKSIDINVVLSGGSNQEFSQNTLFAHELEHARQFNEGEWGFVLEPDKKGTITINGKKYRADKLGYDIGDETKAWQAMIPAANGLDMSVKVPHGSNELPILQRLDGAKEKDADNIIARINNDYKDMKKVAKEGFGDRINLPKGTALKATDFESKQGRRAFGCVGGGCKW